MNSFESRFNTWLWRKQTQLCDACGHALNDGMAGLSATDLDEANKSINNLYAEAGAGYAFPGGDCDYSLVGVGPLYTAHWHGKRVHDAVSVLVPLLPILSGKPLHVFDGGAGTGAALWAWTLIACCADELGSPLPRHTWTSLDLSPSMLAQSDRLWNRLCGVCPTAPKVVKRLPPIHGDLKSPPPNISADVLIASYAFSRVDSNKAAAVAANVAAFISRVGASALAIWTKQNKGAVLNCIKPLLAGWIDRSPGSLFACPLDGRMDKCLAVGKAKFSQLGLTADKDWDRHFNWGRAPARLSLLAMTK